MKLNNQLQIANITLLPSSCGPAGQNPLVKEMYLNYLKSIQPWTICFDSLYGIEARSNKAIKRCRTIELKIKTSPPIFNDKLSSCESNKPRRNTRQNFRWVVFICLLFAVYFKNRNKASMRFRFLFLKKRIRGLDWEQAK